MYTKHLFLGMMALSLLILLTSCSATPDFGFNDTPTPDPPLGVTPIDTSAPTLIVTINIDEDQDATDHLANIVFKFRTHVILEDNYVLFRKGQFLRPLRAKRLSVPCVASTFPVHF